jgi:hypothetical protein
VQFDVNWSFVGKKKKHCDRDDPADDGCGDQWGHVALDPEHRLVLSVVPGRQSPEHTQLLVEDVARRTGGHPLDLYTSDENPAIAAALLEVYGQEQQPPREGKRGRQPRPVKVPPPELTYATVHKTRANNRTTGRSTRAGGGRTSGAACLPRSPTASARPKGRSD